MQPLRDPFRLWPVLCVMLGMAGGLMLHGGGGDPAVAQETNAAPAPADSLQPDERHTIDLFRRASGSVVYINTLARQFNVWTRRVAEVPQGTGSGFLWDDRGHVVTNYHVIARATRAEVVMEDQTTYTAKLIGASADHDLAVLKIQAESEKLKPLPLGDSTDLLVGQNVYAIGNPFGLDHSLSTGVISSLERSITSMSGHAIEEVIQTDAAINPGNSGGPLLDSSGKLIGVNTAIASPSGAYAGIGFAVPVETVRRVVPQLIKHGKYLRPALGISIDPRLNRYLTRRLRVEGLFIIGIYKGTGADKAGLKPARQTEDGRIIPGDIITRIEDRPIRSRSDLFNVLEKYQDKKSVEVEILRAGEKLTVDVELTRPEP